MDQLLYRTDKHGPILIGLGLATVLVAQICSTIPLTAAMAVIGLGATFTLSARHQHELVLQFNLLIYAGIVSFTMGAQFHPRANFVTLIDAAAAIAILLRALKCNAVAVDASGNAYISGYTRGNFSGISAGMDDAFVSKFDSVGNVLWTTQLGTRDDDRSNGVAVDDSGSVYITGHTGKSSNYDAFLTKLDNTGAMAWTRQIDTTRYDESYGVATDSTGSVYITGWSTVGAFLTKFDSHGNTLWTNNYGMNSTTRATSVAVDQFNDVYISGYTVENLWKPNLGMSEAFLVKLDNSGNELWARQREMVGRHSSLAVALDQFGSSFITGVVNNHSNGFSVGDDVYLAKYDASGNEMWTKQVESNNLDRGESVTVDARGNVYVSGYTEAGLYHPTSMAVSSSELAIRFQSLTLYFFAWLTFAVY